MVPRNPTDPLVCVRGLTKRYGRLTALDQVSFSIRPGEVLGLIGPNGSGKTTLFECLGGVLPYDGGEIAVADSPAPRGASPPFFYLPDAIAPWPSQPVRWALDFAVGFFGGPAWLRDDVVSRLELEPLLEAPIGTLSKGQRKRALLGVGLLTPHAVLLADEPFDGLDLRQSREIARALRSYAARGRTLFLSIHQIGEAARVCDRFVLLSGGRVRGEGSCGELRTVALARGASSAVADLEEVFLALA